MLFPLKLLHLYNVNIYNIRKKPNDAPEQLKEGWGHFHWIVAAFILIKVDKFAFILKS